LALHWAAELGLQEVTQLLLTATTDAAAQLREQMEAAGETADSFAPLHVLQIQVGLPGSCLHGLVWVGLFQLRTFTLDMLLLLACVRG
jgi:hypothetical protein